MRGREGRTVRVVYWYQFSNLYTAVVTPPAPRDTTSLWYISILLVHRPRTCPTAPKQTAGAVHRWRQGEGNRRRLPPVLSAVTFSAAAEVVPTLMRACHRRKAQCGGAAESATSRRFSGCATADVCWWSPPTATIFHSLCCKRCTTREASDGGVSDSLRDIHLSHAYQVSGRSRCVAQSSTKRVREESAVPKKTRKYERI